MSCDSDDSTANPSKKQKMDTSSSCQSTGTWVCHDSYRLGFDEKLLIENGSMLTDQHVNFAQHLLKIKFPGEQGLQSTLLQHRMKLDYNKEAGSNSSLFSS